MAAYTTHTPLCQHIPGKSCFLLLCCTRPDSQAAAGERWRCIRYIAPPVRHACKQDLPGSAAYSGSPCLPCFSEELGLPVLISSVAIMTKLPAGMPLYIQLTKVCRFGVPHSLHLHCTDAQISLLDKMHSSSSKSAAAQIPTKLCVALPCLMFQE